ncbi:hypothetical protein GCM10027202_33290 [Microvirgula curvata]|nr:diguanylate cyclase (GGDEF)-like protein [Microvirgula sp. AG722]
MDLSYAQMLENAQRNEVVLRRFQAIELALIGASGFGQFLAGIRDQLPARMALEQAWLLLADSHGEVSAILGYDEVLPDGLLLEREPARLVERLGELPTRVRLGSPGEVLGELALDWAELPGSVALMPLWRDSTLIGLVVLGSRDPERFAPDQATDFIERFAAVTALCLDNVLNRERLKQLGLTDPLTGLYNRRYFDQRIDEELARARRHGAPISCLFLDADHFKRINDTHGHVAGDIVLRTLANRMRGQLRGCDVAARYGGEEFAVLLPQTALGQARLVADRIRTQIGGEPVVLPDGRRVPLTVSIGVSTCGNQLADSPMQLLARADAALYRAKEAGRNCIMSVESGAQA